MSAISELAQQMGLIVDDYQPTVEEMMDLPPTGQVASELDYWQGHLDRVSTNGASAADVARAQARVDFWKSRARVAGIRDERLAKRREQHAECFCLGAGGRNPVTLSYKGADGHVLAAFYDEMPVVAYEDYCPCPDGLAAQDRANEIRLELEAASKKRKLDRIVGTAAIPPIYKGMTADSWRTTMYERGATTKAVGAVLVPISIWYKHNWERTVQPAEAPSLLLLAGPYGTGKSAMAAALGQKWVDDERSVVFRVSTDWFTQLRASPWKHNDDGEPTERELMAVAREADLFILDDWGAEAQTDRGEERFVEQTSMLIDHRIAHGLPTILTTNLKRADMKSRVGERILDHVTSDLASIRINFNDLPNLRSTEW